MMRNTNTISLIVHLKCKFDQHISMPLTTYFSLNAPQLQHKTTNRTRRNWWRHEKIKSQADKLKKAMTTTPNVLQQLEIVVIETKNFWQPFSRRQSCSEKEKLYMFTNNVHQQSLFFSLFSVGGTKTDFSLPQKKSCLRGLIHPSMYMASLSWSLLSLCSIFTYGGGTTLFRERES